MSSFLKSIFNSSNRHKKLCEEWTTSREPVVEGVTFYVRYLGSSPVDDPKSASSTAAGVKNVIHAAKAGTRRPERVSFRVSMDGVKIESTNTGEKLLEKSIYKISYCSADSKYDQVLAFVSSNEDETCECHAFLCSKRKVAEAIALSIAQAFTMAFECWKLAMEAKKNRQSSLEFDELAPRARGDSVCNSRTSSPGQSPEHSSPPSEVSSTSGYQSSSAAGLLLDMDYPDGDDHFNVSYGQPTQRGRKHWIEFGSSDDLLPMGSMFSQHCSSEVWHFPIREEKSPDTRSITSTDRVKSRQPSRNCSFTRRFGSNRYSVSDSEQQLLAAVN